MRIALLVAAILPFCATSAQSQTHKEQWPHNFEIGVRTFFDFGPPFDYYDIFLVKENQTGIAVQRLILTPAADECFAPATIKKAAATLPGSVETLFGEKNPCAIPESELRRERKRCKNCLVFSGADVVMEVLCGSQTRLIRSDILDRDLFDASTKTPEYTSGAMNLVRRLNDAVGPGVMDEPAFPALNQAVQPIKVIDPEIRQSLNAGEYDALFPNAREKPSALLRAALAPHPKPAPTLVSSSPFTPRTAPLPEYPRLALATHTQGDVTFSVEINQTLGVGKITILNGHPLLQQAVLDAVKGWVFAPEAQGGKTEVTISFKLNCLPKSN
jgi:TonB family protein